MLALWLPRSLCAASPHASRVSPQSRSGVMLELAQASVAVYWQSRRSRALPPSTGTRHSTEQLEKACDGAVTRSCRESGDQSAAFAANAAYLAWADGSQRVFLVLTSTTASLQLQCPVRKTTLLPLGDQPRMLGVTPRGTSVMAGPPCGGTSDNEQQRRGGRAVKPEHKILSPLGDQIGVPPHSLSGCWSLPSAEAVQATPVAATNASRFPSGDKLGKSLSAEGPPIWPTIVPAGTLRTVTGPRQFGQAELPRATRSPLASTANSSIPP